MCGYDHGQTKAAQTLQQSHTGLPEQSWPGENSEVLRLLKSHENNVNNALPKPSKLSIFFLQLQHISCIPCDISKREL